MTSSDSFPLLPLLLLLAQQLAGCSAQEPGLVLGASCPEGLQTCRHIGNDLFLDGVSLRGTSGVGLTIRDPPGSIHISNASIAGFDTAIEVVGMTCGACALSIRDSDLMGQRYAVVVASSRASIEIASSRLATAGGGTLRHEARPVVVNGETVTADSVTALNGATALHLFESRVKDLDLREVSISAANRSVWSAIDIDPGSAGSTVDDFFLSGRMSGYRVAIVGDILHKTVEGLEASCWSRFFQGASLDEPARLQAARSFVATDLVVATCEEGGLSLSGDAEVALRGVRLSGGQSCLEVELARSLELRDFEFHDCGYGLKMPSEPVGQETAIIADGLVQRAGYTGLQVKFDHAVVTNVTFIGIGHAWPDPHPVNPNDGGMEAYGALVWRPPGVPLPAVSLPTLDLHGCSFEQVVPNALSSRAQGVANATDNWWGAADGPGVVLHSGLIQDAPVPVGHGGNVTGFVRFLPFLSAPP